MASTPENKPVFNCEKWADCGCCLNGGSCGCGSGCDCGSVRVSDVIKAMETECDKADCKCGPNCSCGKDSCQCGGSVTKTPTQWIEFVKNAKSLSPSS